MLLPALEAELAGLLADPRGSVGIGEKVYVPYEPSGVHFLVASDDPGVTRRLAGAMAGADRVTRLALLHVIGKRADPGVDDVLTAALADPDTRATAAYLLGRPGFKGYPGRPRDVDAVRSALWPHVDDDTTLDDPFAGRAVRAGDAALAAWIRLTGPGRFRIPDRTTADLIGYALPVLDEALRRELLGQARDAHDAPP